jgi:hypothetical protein
MLLPLLLLPLLLSALFTGTRGDVGTSPTAGIPAGATGTKDHWDLYESISQHKKAQSKLHLEKLHKQHKPQVVKIKPSTSNAAVVYLIQSKEVHVVNLQESITYLCFASAKYKHYPILLLHTEEAEAIEFGKIYIHYR